MSTGPSGPGASGMKVTAGPGEAWPEFQKLWARFLDECEDAGTVIVVEGERDRASLRRLHVPARIVALHHGRSTSEVAEELAHGTRRLVVLTDWDTKGGRLAQRLREHLAAQPLWLDLDFRRRLARALRGEIVHVEGLAGWARRSAEGNGETLETWLAQLAAERGDGPVATG
jgi:5S rRNA maturation endonuclease (ribonuclease M5)